jgi:hypothetical protein
MDFEIERLAALRVAVEEPHVASKIQSPNLLLGKWWNVASLSYLVIFALQYSKSNLEALEMRKFLKIRISQ